MIKLTIEYYAELREQAGKENEIIEIEHLDAMRLYTNLKARYHFHSDWQKLRLAVNHEITDWNKELTDGDVIVFIPKVAGG